MSRQYVLVVEDEPQVRALYATLLNDAGFEVRRVRYNQSADRHLRFLDLRDFGLNLFFECVKPS